MKLRSYFPFFFLFTLIFFPAAPISASLTKAFNEIPNNLTIDTDVTGLTLSWTPGAEAQAHDVYFGTDQQQIQNAQPLQGDVSKDGLVDFQDLSLLAADWLTGTTADADGDGATNLLDFAIIARDWDKITPYKGRQTATNFNTGNLALCQNYYWRIDEVNETQNPSVCQGDIWRFTTTCSYSFDDFDPYSSRMIRSVWFDGKNTAGTSYGTNSDLYVENNCVLVDGSAGISLKVDYDTTTAPYVAQVDRNVNSLDLLAMDAELLQLSFLGLGDYELEVIGGCQKGWTGWTAIGNFHLDTTHWGGGIICPCVPHYVSGEGSTGTLRSPNFVLSGDILEICLAGWEHIPVPTPSGWPATNGTRNDFYLKRTSNGAVLQHIIPENNTDFYIAEIDITNLQGTQVYFEAVDACTDNGFAWLAVARLALLTAKPQDNIYVQLQDSNISAEVSYDYDQHSQTSSFNDWVIDVNEFAAQGIDLSDIRNLAIGVGDGIDATPGRLGTFWIDSISFLTPCDYYVSFSQGSDNNDGMSIDSPWKTFTNINNRDMTPGTQIHLKRGDVWNQQLTLRGSGTASQPVILDAYGTGDKPRISRTDKTSHIGVFAENISNWSINDLRSENAKHCMQLNFTTSCKNISVINCDFYNADNENWQTYGWSCGLQVTGSGLDGFTVKNCKFIDCVNGLGVVGASLSNICVEDCYASGGLSAGIALSNVYGGHVKRFVVENVGRYVEVGTCGGFAWGCDGVTIEDCMFATCGNGGGYDGVGFDFEGNNRNMNFLNNVCCDNEGAGIMVMSSGDHNYNINIADCTLYNNVTSTNRETAKYEFLCWNSSSTGTISNCGIYKNSAYNYFSTLWQNFTKTNLRQANLSTISGRPTFWDWAVDGNLEGWHNSSQLSNLQVAGGELHASSTGGDPWIFSPPLWINTHMQSKIVIWTSQTAGTHGQIFFVTDTHPAYDQQKSVSFPIIADGVNRFYEVDMSSCPAWMGVVTEIRLDPTDASASSMTIGWVAFLP